jgi:hypothetical protein
MTRNGSTLCLLPPFISGARRVTRLTGRRRDGLAGIGMLKAYICL